MVDYPTVPAPARFASIAGALGTRTLRTRRTAASNRITTYEASNCHQRSPWRALVGKAWWLLCQPSPRLTIAIGKLFLLSSELLNGRVPQTWHTELMLHVTCCSVKIRTSPPQI